MGCERLVIGLVTGALVAAGCGSTSKNRTVCSPVPSIGSPAVSCVAVVEAPKPKPKPPEPKPEPKPEPEPEPEPKPVVVKKEKIELNRTVQFLPDSAKLVEDSKSLLDEVAKVLDEHPEIKEIQIEGYTDSRLSKSHNKKLSIRRAKSVREYLIKKGIAKDRMLAKGFGADNPIADNGT